MRQIDPKYITTGVITKLDGTPIPLDEPLMLFRGKDRMLIPMLEFYRELCVEAGSPSEHLAAIDTQLWQIEQWQYSNTTKVPD